VSSGRLAITIGGAPAFGESILGVGVVLPGAVVVTGITTAVVSGATDHHPARDTWTTALYASTSQNDDISLRARPASSQP